MKHLFAIACIACPGVASADCLSESTLALQTIERSGYGIVSEGALSEDNGGCHLTRLVLEQTSLLIDVEEIAWTLSGQEAFTTGNGTLALTLAVENARLIPNVSDPWVNYMLNQQNRRNLIDADLDLSWDLAAGTFNLNALDVDLPGENHFSMSSLTKGMTADLLSGNMASLALITLHELSLEVTNTGFADGLILGMAVGRFSGVPGAPETVVEATKEEVSSVVRALPKSFVDEASVTALLALIADAPVPWGTLKMELKAPGGIGSDNLFGLAMSHDPTAPEAIEQAFQGTKVKVTFDALPDPE